MVKIIQEYNKCIGCGTCAALCPDFWELNEEDNKARPKKGKKNSKGNYEFELAGDAGCNKDVVESCPVQIIKIL